MLRWALLLLAGCDGVFGIQQITVVPPDAALPVDAPTGYAAVVLADQPVAYLPLDELSGPVAHDLIGGHDGQYKGSGIMLGADAPFPSARHAVHFDGKSAEVDLGDVLGFPGTAPFTIEAWFSPEVIASTEYYEIVSKWRQPGGATDATGWNVFYSNNDMPEVQYTREAIGHVTAADRTGAAYSAGWHYVAATTDATTNTMALYYDGSEVDSTDVTFGLDMIPEHLVIGADANGPTQATMFGSIAQVAIYDHALTAIQISAHYDARSL